MKDSVPESIPQESDMVLQNYSKEGLRIIGVATKEITLEDLNKSEEELESNFDFQGLIFFQNPLKPQTIPTLQKLINAGVKNIMITGDSILTALSVAYNCNIISSNKNVWIGEVSEDGQLTWEHIESKEVRDKKIHDMSMDIGDS